MTFILEHPPIMLALIAFACVAITAPLVLAILRRAAWYFAEAERDELVAAAVAHERALDAMAGAVVRSRTVR